MTPPAHAARRAWVVGVAGPTGSGKSLVADILARDQPGDAFVVGADWYCRDQSAVPWPERADANMDHPDAIEDTLLAEHLAALRAGRPVESPQYDYATFSRLPATRRVHPHRLIVVEGILVLASEVVRRELDLRIYVDAPLDLCLHRRLLRDESSRGLGVAHTLRQYPRTIRPMFERFVGPSKRHADVVVHNDGPPESLPDAITGLRKRVRAMLSDAEADPATGRPTAAGVPVGSEPGPGGRR
ncbi:Uridine kinase [Micromonospora sp. MW-13]|uniref:uridine kinase n=1 Tax=Micromonospora sp. MW-13 TaxID=2094022 RepID=UPI000E43DD95|nr:uridine kinase [Micromonospora sp. MW-13]RGC68144.1 Uridine kinase [Micromonospora sp. MW-13]